MQEKIQSYLDQSMPEAERKQFEKQLESDPILMKEFTLIKEIEQELGNKDLIEFKSTLSNILESESASESENQKLESKSRVFSLSTKVIGLAASLLFIVGLGWFFLLQNNNGKNEYSSLVAEFSIAYPVQNKIRGENDVEDIYKEYSEKNYSVSSKKLEAFGNNTGDDNAKLFAAISYLKIDENDKALALLDKIAFEASLINPVNYYKGIIYLKKGDRIKAETSLREINQGNKFLYDRAQEILAKIKLK